MPLQRRRLHLRCAFRPQMTAQWPLTTPQVPHQEALSINVGELLMWLDSSWPFLAILAFLFLYVHRNGILLFAWQMILLIQLNNVIVRQVAMREARKVTTLLGVCAVVWHRGDLL